MVKKNDIVELEIERVAFGGEGVGRLDGYAVFVRGAIAGDRVLAQIVKRKKSFSNARLIEILRPSSKRILPQCKHIDLCGGCPWHCCDYETQLEYKRGHVIDSIERIGKIKDVIVHPTIPSPRQFAYRNKMEFSFADRRWLPHAEMLNQGLKSDFALGFHVRGAYYKVVQIEECLLQADIGNQILQKVSRYAEESGFPPYGIRTHTGYFRFLTLRHSFFHDQWMINIVTSKKEPEALSPLVDSITTNFNNIASIVNTINPRKGSTAIGEEEVLLYGEPLIEEVLMGYRFTVSPSSFFQTNTACAEKLYGTVVKYASLTGSETVLDLYSGTGTIPIIMSNSCRKVIGVEIEQSAVRDAESNCKRNNVTNCAFLCGDIRYISSLLQEEADVVVIDPPRAGMHPDVIKQLLVVLPKRIIYVSCNPTTMARDIEMMVDAYRLEEVQPVDMFPHTFHIESVARLQRIV
ncbi:MAG: 23S rRNA (uracil(1939)-C(5))-methyltransferase RlmD [Pseudomonadota bacterium]